MVWVIWSHRGDHRSPKWAGWFFPKPAGCQNTAGVVDPVIRKEELSANRDERFGHGYRRNWGPVNKHGSP